MLNRDKDTEYNQKCPSETRLKENQDTTEDIVARLDAFRHPARKRSDPCPGPHASDGRF